MDRKTEKTSAGSIGRFRKQESQDLETLGGKKKRIPANSGGS